MDRLKIRIELTSGIEPKYQTPGSSGMDLCAAGGVTIAPKHRVVISCGFRIEIPDGYEGQVRSRSGLALRQGLIVLNSPGTVDSDYRGDMKVILINLGNESVTIGKGDRIAQLVISPVVRAKLIVVSNLSKTARAEGGFGSTGVK